MVDVTTTITFGVEYTPDQDHTRVVADLPESDTELRALLKTQLGAEFSDDHRQFDIALQYALTASNHARAAGNSLEFRPKDAAIPLRKIVDEAERLATQRENWPVTVVEILDESTDYAFQSGVEDLAFYATCTARVTQTRP
ncbi:hypothetical protein B4U78_008800 [Microbacterium esteraromaticum]|nr:hypothetical protein B4U78_008800 [Microbacterium esteraromaticum]